MNALERLRPRESCEVDNGKQTELLCSQFEATESFYGTNVFAYERSPTFFIAY